MVLRHRNDRLASWFSRFLGISRVAVAWTLLIGPACMGLLLAGPQPASAATGGSVSSVSVSLAPNDAVNVPGVAYSVKFTTSAAGALDSSGSITVSLPAGTVLVNSFTVEDVTTGQSVDEGAYSITGSTAQVATNGLAIAGGDQVLVTLNDVTNGPATGTNTLTVSTSSDTAAATGSFTLVAQNPLPGSASVSVGINYA